jgi:hypothetical protein
MTWIGPGPTARSGANADLNNVLELHWIPQEGVNLKILILSLDQKCIYTTLAITLLGLECHCSLPFSFHCYQCVLFVALFLIYNSTSSTVC